MPTPLPKHANALLLRLLNSLADFDGQISEDAASLLNELSARSEILPPLYADVFRLPVMATCADLVNRIESLSQQQVAIASYAFQIFRSYEQMLRANTNVTFQQQAAYESQLERIRLLVVKTRSTLHEAIGDV